MARVKGSYIAKVIIDFDYEEACLIFGDFEKSTEKRSSASYPQVLRARKMGVCGACWIFCAS